LNPIENIGKVRYIRTELPTQLTYYFMATKPNNQAKADLEIDMSVQQCMDKSDRPEIAFETYLGMIEQVENDNPDVANNTKLMFTKLRKVYYDSFGWNDELIRGTEDIAPFAHIPAGMESKNHIVKMQNGDLYDIAHIFAIVDAGNHEGYFTPLPNTLMFLRWLFPTVQSRLTASGWMGDLSSASGQFFLIYKSTKNQLSLAQKQKVVDEYAPCDKMISNADALIIINNYGVSASAGKKVSEILRDYYDAGGKGDVLRQNRYSLFAAYLGLRDWSGQTFINEKQWREFYFGQLKTCSAFYLLFFREKLSTLVWSLLIWVGFYKKEVAVAEVLDSFITGLKSALKTES